MNLEVLSSELLAVFISQCNIQVRIISVDGVDPAPGTKSVSPARPPSEDVHRTYIGYCQSVSVNPWSPPREGQSESSSSFTSEREVSVAGEGPHCKCKFS